MGVLEPFAKAIERLSGATGASFLAIARGRITDDDFRRVAEVYVRLQEGSKASQGSVTSSASPTHPRGEGQAGWVLVPREPTFEMVSKGGAAVWGHASPGKHALMQNAYRAMLAASPPAELPPPKRAVREGEESGACGRLARAVSAARARGYDRTLYETADVEAAFRLADEAEPLLVACCGLLDLAKADWGDGWSSWDQSIRDGISAWLWAKRPLSSRERSIGAAGEADAARSAPDDPTIPPRVGGE